MSASDLPIQFTLDFPPSVNSLFANIIGLGRTKTARYREWKTAAAWDIKRQVRSQRISGCFAIKVVAPRPKGNAPDLDNILKPIIDACVAAGVTDDDRKLRHIEAYYENKAGGSVLIELREANQ